MCRSLRYFKPVLPFRRDRFLYNNHLYVLAGYVAEVLEGQSWEQLVAEYLLQPLNMTSTTFVRDVLMTSADELAVSCGWTERGCVPIDIQQLEYFHICDNLQYTVSRKNVPLYFRYNCCVSWAIFTIFVRVKTWWILYSLLVYLFDDIKTASIEYTETLLHGDGVTS